MKYHYLNEGRRREEEQERKGGREAEFRTQRGDQGLPSHPN